MAIVKCFNAIGGHLWGDGIARDLDPPEALEIAKGLQKKAEVGEHFFVGEKGKLEVNPAKITCSDCKERLGI